MRIRMVKTFLKNVKNTKMDLQLLCRIFCSQQDNAETGELRKVAGSPNENNWFYPKLQDSQLLAKLNSQLFEVDTHI